MKNRQTSATTKPIKNTQPTQTMAMDMKNAIDISNLNAIPFKNSTIELLNRKRYDISREFDGQEVGGTITERPTIGGGRIEVEKFNNMPGGGSFTSRTRYNENDLPVRRTTKARKIN